MNLLRKIQEAIITPDSKIKNILLMSKVLANRLGINELAEWSENELSGYSNEKEIPQYRIISSPSLKGNFSGSFGSSFFNYPIPSICLPDELKDFTGQLHLGAGIGGYEDVLRQDQSNLHVPWPDNMVALLNERQQIYEHQNLVNAWFVVPRGFVVNIIDSVRNKLLSFVLELEKQFPENQDDLTEPDSKQKEKISNIFNQHFYGNVGNIASGSYDFKQSAHIVTEGNIEELKKALDKLGVEKDEISNLETAIQKDGTKKEMGVEVSSWLSKMISKASSGGLQISMAIVCNIIPKLISNYLGIPN